jgi:hypothetical protein
MSFFKGPDGTIQFSGLAFFLYLIVALFTAGGAVGASWLANRALLNKHEIILADIKVKVSEMGCDVDKLGERLTKHEMGYSGDQERQDSLKRRLDRMESLVLDVKVIVQRSAGVGEQAAKVGAATRVDQIKRELRETPIRTDGGLSDRSRGLSK